MEKPKKPENHSIKPVPVRRFERKDQKKEG